MFTCDKATLRECMKLKIFGVSKGGLAKLWEIGANTVVFLYDFESKEVSSEDQLYTSRPASP